MSCTAAMILAALGGAFLGGAFGSWLTWRAARPLIDEALDAAREARP